jgi:cytochrome c oxidase cbb3-type subunit 4
MDAGTWRGLFTALMLLLFVGIAVWAWSRRRHRDFEEASRLPLEDDPPAEDRRQQ